MKERNRAIRLHWIKYHIKESKKDKIEIFSCNENIKGRKTIRTYIYDVEQNYVIVLELQRSKIDYYLITAYFIDEEWGKKKIKKQINAKLNEVF